MKGLTLQVHNAIQSGIVGVRGDLAGVKEGIDGIQDGVKKMESKIYECKSEGESLNSVVSGH